MPPIGVVFGGLVEPYAKYADVTRPGSLPAAIVADWVDGWIWDPTIILGVVEAPRSA